VRLYGLERSAFVGISPCARAIGDAPTHSHERFRFDPGNPKEEINPFRFRGGRGKIRCFFYPSPYFEKGFIANRPTKKSCEIAAILVWPSY
jgi:hypothetical protein